MNNEFTVLLVEDDIQLNRINSRLLKLNGYQVLTAMTLAEARERMKEIAPDIILLDVILPDGNGFEFCAEIRDETQAHILFLTAKREHADMMKGLMTGGDDYLMKPFHPDALVAKVASAARRRAMDKIIVEAPAKTLSAGNLSLDFAAIQAFVNGVDLLLTPKEFALLRLFAENENTVLGNELIYEKVWNAPLMGDIRALQKRVSALRAKLKDSGSDHMITTVYGNGYLFEKTRSES